MLATPLNSYNSACLGHLQFKKIMPTIPACPQCVIENTYPDDDHEVDCKMGAGNFMLKACYLRKA